MTYDETVKSGQKIDSAIALLVQVVQERSPVALASSFGAEDMVLTDMIAESRLPVEIFTLDTGRLSAETHQVMQKTRRRYGLSIRAYAPDAADIEAYIDAHGPDAFFDSIELRQRCCHIRKVLPLRRALAGKKAWITGLRRQQSVTRRDLPFRAWDAENGLEKISPLADWTDQEVWGYIRSRDVPYNALHDKGYASIGCAPCTRAITVGEDIRAGRWWWEDYGTRECGLHPAHKVA